MSRLHYDGHYFTDAKSGNFWYYANNKMIIKFFDKNYSQIKGKEIYVYSSEFDCEVAASSVRSDIEYKALREIFNRAWCELKGE